VGNFSCYPDSGSECVLYANAWATQSDVPDPPDIWPFDNPGILDSLNYNSYIVLPWGDSLNPCYWHQYGPKVEESPTKPSHAILYQNSPNPFNSATGIAFTLTENSHVSLKITDALGKHVCTIFDGMQSSGSHTIRWNGKDDTGNEMPSGVYFCTMTAGGNVIDRKMMMLTR
jgi:hypothetical protein